ncbi:MAG TPA: DUF721 domain-containing protein [Candidatus Tenderia sp.]|nr:DUF721 domain-containing protein [Candidatus Tenderia sp.]
MSKQHSISKILGSSQTDLRRLVGATKQLQQLNRRLQNNLPKPLQKHCQVANRRDNTLVVTVDSPVWATKLRLFVPKLTKILRTDNISQIEVCVRPANGSPKRRTFRPPPHMSTAASGLLSQLANCTSDQKLRKALIRLARHGEEY